MFPGPAKGFLARPARSRPCPMLMHPHTTWNGSSQTAVTRVTPVGAIRAAGQVGAAGGTALVTRKDGERGRNRTFNLLIKSSLRCLGIE